MKTENKLAILMGAFAASSLIDPDSGYETKEEQERIAAKRRRAKGILTDADREALRKAEERRARKAMKQGYC